ncbi:hypothetical protein C0Q70_05071 [Pomacea canaliculata]|uniref:Tumor protein p53-inducible protein 11 n=1 Tax=Pomacea canaliculata TaxID=400727 RepID=A0A2T7PK76_POMCA|nr:hypothetical protein C0Q70_05071 [Pomacea canaliculata]
MSTNVGHDETDIKDTKLRKLSSSDLHSRLKTRKVLGVGETDDGDVHRSKALVLPSHLFDITFETEEGQYVTLPVRLYGAALLALAIFHWNCLYATDRDVIRMSLLSSAVYFTLQTAGLIKLHLEETGSFALGRRRDEPCPTKSMQIRRGWTGEETQENMESDKN